jgi:hypothetical protein
LSDDANLESRTAQALRHYREALAKVETLEREEAWRQSSDRTKRATP